jgi:hypothetical protein
VITAIYLHVCTYKPRGVVTWSAWTRVRQSFYFCNFLHCFVWTIDKIVTASTTRCNWKQLWDILCSVHSSEASLCASTSSSLHLSYLLRCVKFHVLNKKNFMINFDPSGHSPCHGALDAFPNIRDIYGKSRDDLCWWVTNAEERYSEVHSCIQRQLWVLNREPLNKTLLYFASPSFSGALLFRTKHLNSRPSAVRHFTLQ